MIEQILSISPLTFLEVIFEIISPIIHVFGFWIFLIIFGLFLFAIWIHTMDVTIPFVIGILSMGIFGLFFPKEAIPIVILMFIICGAIILVKLLKDAI